ncbi:hypothetical protein LSAT2_013812 [Lamellibrachia satsuma]|nr:hypothetical protein LSAT2_013812 [Lamellibrachia satsuma]
MLSASTSHYCSAVSVAAVTPSVTMLKLCVLATLVGTASAVFYTKSGDAEVPMLGKRSHTTSAGERGRLSANLAVERAVRRKDGGQLSEFAHRLSSVLMHRLRQSKTLGYRRRQHLRVSTDVHAPGARLWKRLVLFQKAKPNVILNDHSVTRSQSETDESRLNMSRDTFL